MLNNKQLIYKDDARRAVLRANPSLVYCVDGVKEVDAVEVVHGRWEDGYAVDCNGKKIYESIDCSVCNDIFKIESYDREYWKKRFKACPFCGAIMDGEVKEND